MWFVEWLLSILTYPIEWFWDKASVYKEEGKKGRVILLLCPFFKWSGVVRVRSYIWMYMDLVQSYRDSDYRRINYMAVFLCIL